MGVARLGVLLLVRTTVALGVILSVAAAPTSFAQEQTWKINLKNAEISEFVTQVAAITGKTLIVDQRVKGKVTVISSESLDRDGIYELFLAVLRVNGFAAIDDGKVVRIQQQALAKQSGSPLDTAPKLSGEQIVTRVIPAQNVDSAELVKILRPMIPQYGHIAAIAQPNVVIISDHAENIVRLMRLIEQIDVSDEDEVVVVPMKEAFVGTIVELLERVAPEQIGRNAKGPQRIQVIANERNNSLVLRGKPRPVAEVLKLIDKLDQPATSTGATQVLYLAHADAKSVAEILNGLISGKQAAAAGGEGGAAQAPQPLSIQPDTSLNAIVIRADPSTVSEVTEIVKKLDVRRTQVLIEAAIVEISLDKSKALGVDFAGVDATGSSIPFFSTALTGTLGPLFNALRPNTGDDDTSNDTPDASRALGAVNQSTIAVAKFDPDGVSWAAILQALANSSEANLLSTPSIMTLDNQEAKIVVGQEVPFRTGTFTTSTDGADNPFTTIQREDVGLTLTVTPHIHEGQSVRLEVAQEVSSVVAASIATIGESGTADIITNKRQIETTVLADDKQTVVLGGLIQDDITKTQRKVPLLGDIPGLGKLFQSNTDQRTKRNLLVFLRPTVLRTKEDTTSASDRKYDAIWDVEIRSEEGPPEIESIYDGRPD
jgi:general secretion pathway protein D